MYSTDTCVVVVVASSWQGGELNTKPQPEHPVNESPGRREVQDCDGTRRSAWPTALSFGFLLSRPPGFIAPPWEQEECARARRPPPVVPCTYLSTACRTPRAPHPPPPKKSPAPSWRVVGGMPGSAREGRGRGRTSRGLLFIIEQQQHIDPHLRGEPIRRTSWRVRSDRRRRSGRPVSPRRKEYAGGVTVTYARPCGQRCDGARSRELRQTGLRRRRALVHFLVRLKAARLCRDAS